MPSDDRHALGSGHAHVSVLLANSSCGKGRGRFSMALTMYAIVATLPQ